MTSNLIKGTHLGKHIVNSIPANWHRAFSFGAKEIDIHALAKHIEEQTTIVLHGKGNESVLHGFVSSTVLPIGGIGICSWCKDTLEKDIRHQCVAISLYENEAHIEQETPKGIQKVHIYRFTMKEEHERKLLEALTEYKNI